MARTTVLGLVAVLDLVGGCGGRSTSSLRAQLTGRSFVSESVEGHELVAGSRMNVSFDDDGKGMGASAGCNGFFGAYDLDGDVVHIPMLGSTAKGCGASLDAQDEWLLAFVTDGPTLALDDPRLVMATPSVRVHLLDRKIAIPDHALVDTHWLGQGFSDGMVATFGPGSGDVALSLGSDGHVGVDTSCQTGSGSFTATATTMTFAALTYDGAPCADATFQRTSDQVLSVLDGSPVTFTIHETTLTVTRGMNSLMFVADR